MAQVRPSPFIHPFGDLLQIRTPKFRECRHIWGVIQLEQVFGPVYTDYTVHRPDGQVEVISHRPHVVGQFGIEGDGLSVWVVDRLFPALPAHSKLPEHVPDDRVPDRITLHKRLR